MKERYGKVNERNERLNEWDEIKMSWYRWLTTGHVIFNQGLDTNKQNIMIRFFSLSFLIFAHSSAKEYDHRFASRNNGRKKEEGNRNLSPNGSILRSDINGSISMILLFRLKTRSFRDFSINEFDKETFISARVCWIFFFIFASTNRKQLGFIQFVHLISLLTIRNFINTKGLHESSKNYFQMLFKLLLGFNSTTLNILFWISSQATNIKTKAKKKTDEKEL